MKEERVALPIDWIKNNHAETVTKSEAVDRILPPGITEKARRFHQQVAGYRMSPLKNLSNLASMLGVKAIWVKDESLRLSLNSFKVLGGSFAIYRFLQAKLGCEEQDLTLQELQAEVKKQNLTDLIFASATDGNHGRGVAWAADQLGFECIIYVHKLTSKARIHAIEEYGAKVIVIDGTYDDAVRQINEDAKKNNWQVISDTSWEGYEDIPSWVMQGYTTMLSETQEQLSAQGIVKPTHVFVQAGVGALAAATIGFYQARFGKRRPRTVVVEPDQAACLFSSVKKGDGKPHNVDGEMETIMAGLACGEPSALAWDILWDCADVFMSCPDYVAAKGMRIYGVPLADDPFIVSGESGAVTLGALTFVMDFDRYADLRAQLGLGPDSQILLINSEGNTDPDDFRKVVWEGRHSVPKPYRFRQ